MLHDLQKLLAKLSEFSRITQSILRRKNKKSSRKGHGKSLGGLVDPARVLANQIGYFMIKMNIMLVCVV